MRNGVLFIRMFAAACFVLISIWATLSVSMGLVALSRNHSMPLLSGPSASVVTYLRAQQEFATAAHTVNRSSLNVNRAAASRSQFLALSALTAQPLSAPSLRTLGLAAGMLGNANLADVVLATAAKTSRRDEPTQFYMLERSFESDDLESGASYFDALMRLDSPARAEIFRLTVPLMQNDLLLKAISKRMALKPEWRDAFLYEVTTTAPPATALATLRRLRKIGSGPTAAELVPYFERMATHTNVPDSYQDWMDFFHIDPKLSPLVRDGGFERQTGVLPFTWLLTTEDAINATIAKRDDGKGYALHVELYTLAAKPVARQLLTLSPGRYRLSGTYLAEAGSWVGMEWTLMCNDPSGLVFGHVPLPHSTNDQWQHSESQFTVPSACSSQWLILASATQADILDRSFWIDNVSVARVVN